MSDNNRKKCHLSKPSAFDGKDYETWMFTVDIYIRRNSVNLETDQNKILFALSFMTSGMPAQWARNFILTATALGTWDTFKVKLSSSFENKNKCKDATAKLSALRQGSQTAEEFFQQFNLTWHEADLMGNVDNVLIDILE